MIKTMGLILTRIILGFDDDKEDDYIEILIERPIPTKIMCQRIDGTWYDDFYKH